MDAIWTIGFIRIYIRKKFENCSMVKVNIKARVFDFRIRVIDIDIIRGCVRKLFEEKLVSNRLA